MEKWMAVAIVLGPLVVYIALGALKDWYRDRVFDQREAETRHTSAMHALGRATGWEPSDGEACDPCRK